MKEKDNEIQELNKSLQETKACLQTLEQDLKALRQEKLDLNEELDNLRRSHEEEMEDMVDVVNELKRKDEDLELAKLKLDEQASDIEKAKKVILRDVF